METEELSQSCDRCEHFLEKLDLNTHELIDSESNFHFCEICCLFSSKKRQSYEHVLQHSSHNHSSNLNVFPMTDFEEYVLWFNERKPPTCKKNGQDVCQKLHLDKHTLLGSKKNFCFDVDEPTLLDSKKTFTFYDVDDPDILLRLQLDIPFPITDFEENIVWTNERKPPTYEKNGQDVCQKLHHFDVDEPTLLDSEKIFKLFDVGGQDILRRPGFDILEKLYTITSPYSCNECGELFSQKSECDEHNLLHSKGVFDCVGNYAHQTLTDDVGGQDLCHKSDLDKQGLLDISDNCYLCKNNKKFFEKSSLNKRTQPKEMFYFCDVCREKFTKKSALKFHKMFCAKEKTYSCKFCDKRYIRKKNLIRHIQQFHSTNQLPSKHSFSEESSSNEHTRRRRTFIKALRLAFTLLIAAFGIMFHKMSIKVIEKVIKLIIRSVIVVNSTFSCSFLLMHLALEKFDELLNS